MSTDAAGRIRSMLGRLLRTNVKEVLEPIAPIAIDSHQRYRDAETFKNTITLEVGKDYDWVWDFAKDSYDRAIGVYEALDDKANDIIKYLGGGAGLFTLGVMANINHANADIARWALPSFAMAIISVFFAVLARKPNEVKHPPSIRDAFKYASHYKDAAEAKATFIGQWNLALEGMYLAIAVKSVRVAWATWTFCLAIAFLALPLFVAVGR